MALTPDQLALLGLDSAPPDALPVISGVVIPAAPESRSQGEILERDLADLIGVSDRQIRAYVKAGLITRVSPGTYIMRDAVRGLFADLRGKAQRGVAVNDELKTQRVRKEQAAAEKLELANAVKRGELVSAAEVQATWQSITTELRSALLAIPARLPIDVRETVDGEIRETLERLSNG